MNRSDGSCEGVWLPVRLIRRAGPTRPVATLRPRGDRARSQH
ncbi:hypothetical protein ABIC73_002702 [Prescottella equi]